MNTESAATLSCPISRMEELLLRDITPERARSLIASFDGISGRELAMLASHLLETAPRVDLGPVIDLCGTGGDGKETFNISTATAFLLSAMGFPVAKHGNGAATSQMGSSDILRALRVPLPKTADEALRIFEKTNLVFLHAPHFYRGLAHLAPIRREIGRPTVFNLLGPILNPARPSFQLVGVSKPTFIDLFASALTELKRTFACLHGQDGYDELSLTSAATVRIGSEELTLTSRDFGLFRNYPRALLRPASVSENVQLITTILRGRGTPAQERVLAANAALAAHLMAPSRALSDLTEEAIQVLRSGLPAEKLGALQAL